jgi:hypothetical protein
MSMGPKTPEEAAGVKKIAGIDPGLWLGHVPYINSAKCLADIYGIDASYDFIVGLSGAAFGLAFARQWCPSSRHRLATHFATRALEELGFSFDVITQSDKGVSEDGMKQIIMASIDKGNPVFVAEWEGGALVTGYTAEGGLLRNDPDKGTYAPVDGAPKEAVVVTGHKPQELRSVAKLRTSLQQAVNTLTKVDWGQDYLGGFAAYEKWIADLRSQSAIEEVMRRYEKHGDGKKIVLWINSYILGGLQIPRRSAPPFLRSVSEVLGKAEKNLKAAAGMFEKVTQIIWETQKAEDNPDWQAYLKEEADNLQKALWLEREALAELKAALVAMD